MKKDSVFSEGKSFSEYMFQYAKEGSGERDRVKNLMRFKMNQIE
jgi:hypothetical protein